MAALSIAIMKTTPGQPTASLHAAYEVEEELFDAALALSLGRSICATGIGFDNSKAL
jgi:hypothetical protein